MTTIEIHPASKADHAGLAQVWEASVRATHDFLAPEHLQYLRERIVDDFFPQVSLWCARSADGVLAGFVGVAENKMEMLFIDPAVRGRGIGRVLAEHAIRNAQVDAVDVNEQNEQAVGFYRRLGFQPYERSPLDGLGWPYPILHLRLADDRVAQPIAAE